MKKRWIVIFLLCTGSMCSLPAFARQRDSLLSKLGTALQADQQYAVLHQLYTLTYQDNYAEAEKYISTALSIALQLNNQFYLQNSYSKLAVLYEMQEDYTQSYLFFLEAQKITEEQNFQKDFARSKYNIGRILYKLKRYKESLAYLQQAVVLSKASKQDSLTDDITISLGLCLLSSEQHVEGFTLLNTLQQKAIEKDNQALLGNLYFEWLYYYKVNHVLDSALAMADDAAACFDKTNNFYYSIVCQREKGLLHAAAGEPEKAILLLRKALGALQPQRYSGLQISLLKSLSACYYQQHDNTLGQYYKTKADKLSDSLALTAHQVNFPAQTDQVNQRTATNLKSSMRFSFQTILLTIILLVGMALISFMSLRRYRRIKTSIKKEKEDLLVKAMNLVEEEKQTALQLARRLVEKEKEMAMRQAREIIEKAREEARLLQAQVTTTSVLLANKTDYLLQLHEKLSTMESIDGKRLAKEIKTTLGDTDYWADFIRNFNLLHSHVIDRITKKHPELTPNEIKLICFVLSDLSNKEIASIFSVEPESVKKARYRLKKKLNLKEEDNLRLYLQNLQ